MAKNVGSVINYCSNEERFLKGAIEEAILFSEEIIVVACDHFFNGTPENIDALYAAIAEFPKVKFILFPYIKELLSHTLYKKVGSTAFWHSMARYLGFVTFSKEIDYIFFLDVDEIAEGKKVEEWLNEFPYTQYSAIRFANYWYFRESFYRAKNLEDSILLVKRDDLKQRLFVGRGERDALFDFPKGKKLRGQLGLDNLPLFHHYSWVRTKEEMLKKVTSWGHAQDRNWVELVEKEFAQEFSGRDFVHNYEFEEVIPFKKIDLQTKSKRQVSKNEELNNMIKISNRQFLRFIYPNFFKYLLKTS